MDKKFLKMISLSALICCFGNVTAAKVVNCGALKTSGLCKTESECGWVEDSADLQKLKSSTQQDISGQKCFHVNFLKNNSCTFQHTFDDCMKVDGCDFEGTENKGTCTVSGSKKKVISSPKTAPLTEVKPSSSEKKATPSPKPTPSTEVTHLSVCSPRKTPGDCSDRTKEGKCFWKANFFGKGGKCIPVGSTVKK